MFHVINHGVKAGSDQISLFFPRRGSSLRIGGTRFRDVLFQRPPQVEGTKCEVIGTQFAKALDRAWRTKSPVWEPIASSLEFFLLGHAETPELDWDSCTMLSAMALERLLEPKESRAQGIAETFATLWAPFASRTMEQVRKRVKPDPKWANDQSTWPVHRKWMKELYEARSSMAHRGPRSDFSMNWEGWQHIVIAAFVYPLVVKLNLEHAGLYQLSDREKGACDALDELLASDWGKDWREPPEWPQILAMSEASRVLQRNVEEAYQEVTQRKTCAPTSSCSSRQGSRKRATRRDPLS